MKPLSEAEVLWQKAGELYRDALRLSSNFPDALMGQALLAMDEGHYRSNADASSCTAGRNDTSKQLQPLGPDRTFIGCVWHTH